MKISMFSTICGAAAGSTPDSAAAPERGCGARHRVGVLEGARQARAPRDPDRDQRAEADDEEHDLRAGDLHLELDRRVVDEPEVEPREQRTEEVAEELRPRQLPEHALDVRRGLHPRKV